MKFLSDRSNSSMQRGLGRKEKKSALLVTITTPEYPTQAYQNSSSSSMTESISSRLDIVPGSVHHSEVIKSRQREQGKRNGKKKKKAEEVGCQLKRIRRTRRLVVKEKGESKEDVGRGSARGRKKLRKDVGEESLKRRRAAAGCLPRLPRLHRLPALANGSARYSAFARDRLATSPGRDSVVETASSLPALPSCLHALSCRFVPCGCF